MTGVLADDCMLFSSFLVGGAYLFVCLKCGLGIVGFLECVRIRMPFGEGLVPGVRHGFSV